MNASDLETRLAALERAKRVGTAICALMVVGAATLALRTSQGSGSEIFEASMFVVRDEEGRIRAKLEASPNRSVNLVLYNPDEVPQVLLSVTGASEPSLRLRSASGYRGATLFVPNVEDAPGQVLLEDGLMRLRWGGPYSLAVRSGLSVLAQEQELYWGRTGSYAKEISELSPSPPEGVVLLITDASPAGWAGSAAHTAVPGKSCVMYSGTGVEIPTTAGEGRQPEQPISPACDRF
jgi:hypothetical protein